MGVSRRMMMEDEGECVVVDELLAYTVIPFVVFFVSYWSLSAFFTICDRLLLHLSTRPEKKPWLDRFKIQKGLDEERLRFGWAHLFHVLGLHIFISIPIGLALSPLWPNHTSVFCPPPFLFAWLRLIAPTTLASTNAPEPLTLTRFAFEFISILILFEIFFYYSHRTLHQPLFYKRVHKMHHYYTAPVGPAAQYVHWIEHVVANSLAPILPAIIVGAHPLTYNFWIFLATCTVVASHSGYGRYALITSEEHDLHHKHFNVNFGTLNVLDYLHGTSYAQSAHHVRDREKRKSNAKGR